MNEDKLYSFIMRGELTNECVSDKIRKSADSRKAEEDKIKWHTHRGTSMINYVDFADLANIMGQNYDLFEVHIVIHHIGHAVPINR